MGDPKYVILYISDNEVEIDSPEPDCNPYDDEMWWIMWYQNLLETDSDGCEEYDGFHVNTCERFVVWLI